MGWTIGEQMTAELVLAALNMALLQRKPEGVIATLECELIDRTCAECDAYSLALAALRLISCEMVDGERPSKRAMARLLDPLRAHAGNGNGHPVFKLKLL